MHIKITIVGTFSEAFSVQHAKNTDLVYMEYRWKSSNAESYTYQSEEIDSIIVQLRDSNPRFMARFKRVRLGVYDGNT